MASNRDREPATFDDGWDLDSAWAEEEEGLPPTLDPRARPGAARLPAPEEDRDTLLPPVAQSEYVQTMMTLGELDDPSDTSLAQRSKAASDAEARGPAALGLVMAKENELLLPTEPARPPPSARSAGFRALPARAPEPPRPAPQRGAPVIPGAPVPRAPSIPPEPDDGDPLAGLESLDALDEPGAITMGEDDLVDIGTIDPISVSLKAASTPPRHDPLRPPSSGGIRLLKSTPVTRPDDRITPAAIEIAPSSVADNLREMRARFDARNYGGALVLAESVLVSAPENALARQTAESCREQLAGKYLGSLGERTSIPHVSMPPEEVRWLSLDHRAGFLLSFIDGATSIEEVLDASSMPELEALRIMFELRQQGVIEIQTPPRRAGRR